MQLAYLRDSVEMIRQTLGMLGPALGDKYTTAPPVRQLVTTSSSLGSWAYTIPKTSSSRFLTIDRRRCVFHEA